MDSPQEFVYLMTKVSVTRLSSTILLSVFFIKVHDLMTDFFTHTLFYFIVSQPIR